PGFRRTHGSDDGGKNAKRAIDQGWLPPILDDSIVAGCSTIVELLASHETISSFADIPELVQEQTIEPPEAPIAWAEIYCHCVAPMSIVVLAELVQCDSSGSPVHGIVEVLCRCILEQLERLAMLPLQLPDLAQYPQGRGESRDQRYRPLIANRAYEQIGFNLVRYISREIAVRGVIPLPGTHDLQRSFLAIE